MKAILKLIFLGVIISLGVKYLNENNISISDKAKEAKQWIEKQIEELNSDGFSEASYDKPSPSSHPNSTSSSYESHTNAIDLNTANVDAMEIRIPAKSHEKNQRFAELDRYAFEFPASNEQSIEYLTTRLIQNARNDMEKTRLIFSWIAAHVSYDDYGFNTGNYGDLSAEGVFKSRRAVCDGFGDLFAEMGRIAGLEAVEVHGYAKGISYRSGSRFNDTNHAWNLVKINGQWKLFDVTWAQGYGTAVNGKLVSKKEFKEYWFDVPPEEFIFSHLPEDSKWQLTNTTISKTQFESIPNLNNAYFNLGFDGNYCLENALKGTLSDPPESYSNKGNIRAISTPYGKFIERGKYFRFIFESDEVLKMAIINNGEWIYFQKEDNIFTAVINPKPGILKISTKDKKETISFNTLLEYKVL